MAVEQIELTVYDVCRIAQPHLFKLPRRLSCIRFSFCQILRADPSEFVIHNRIKGIAAQPGLCVFPHFPDQHRLRVFFFYRLTESAPEIAVDLICHIQTPAVHMIFPDPVSADIRKVHLHFPLRRVQFRHFPLIGKACITRYLIGIFRPPHRKFQLVKPFAVAGLLSFFHHILKREELPAAMVEHAVDHELHSSRVQLLHEFFQFLLRSHARIDMIII